MKLKTLLLFMMVSIMSCTYAQTKSDKVIDLMKTGHSDVKDGVSTVYGDGKEAVKAVYSDLKDIAPKLEGAVREIAKGLGAGVSDVWDVLVRQQMVWSICFLILTISACTNWFVFYRRLYPKRKSTDYITLKRDMMQEIPNPDHDPEYARKADNDSSSSYYNKADKRYARTLKVNTGATEEYLALKSEMVKENEGKEWFSIVHLGICITLSYFSFIHFSSMLTGFINPKFGAMMQIAEMVMKLK